MFRKMSALIRTNKISVRQLSQRAPVITSGAAGAERFTKLIINKLQTVLSSTACPRFADIAFGGGRRIGDVFGYTVPFAFGIRIAKNQRR